MTTKRKWIFGIAVALLLTAVGLFVYLAVTKDKPEPEPVIESVFAKVIDEDFALARTHLAEGEEDVCFYEAEARFNTAVDTTAAKDLKIVETRTVFQLETGVLFIYRDLEDSTVEEDFHPNDLYLECYELPGSVYPYTLEASVELLQKSEKVAAPNSNVVILRRPVAAHYWENPLYIFGVGSTGFVFVDTVTREVGSLE